MINGKNNNIFIWSDDWYIENDTAWFVSGKNNILFCLDLNKKECKYAVKIPDINSGKIRCNPRCIKYGGNIFCMPDFGNSIWVYDIHLKNFSEISVNNPEQVKLGLFWVWKYNDSIFVVSYGLRKIIEINIDVKRIKESYNICKEGLITDSIKFGNSIYSLSDDGKIYQFDIGEKNMVSYVLPNIGRKFYAFSFDGENFWMGGYRKEIYVWDKDEDSIKVIDNFPNDFGIYNFGVDSDGRPDFITEEYDEPTFEYIIIAGEYVWFIPFVSNRIVYVNKYSYELNVLEIKEEVETKYSILKSELKQKYVLEYVTDERYIGLFSAKNRCILEIDAKLLKYRFYNLKFSDKCLQECAVIFKNMFRERFAFERDLYREVLLSNCHLLSSKDKNSVGNKIYRELISDSSSCSMNHQKNI